MSASPSRTRQDHISGNAHETWPVRSARHLRDPGLGEGRGRPPPRCGSAGARPGKQPVGRLHAHIAHAGVIGSRHTGSAGDQRRHGAPGAGTASGSSVTDWSLVRLTADTVRCRAPLRVMSRRSSPPVPTRRRRQPSTRTKLPHTSTSAASAHRAPHRHVGKKAASRPEAQLGARQASPPTPSRPRTPSSTRREEACGAAPAREGGPGWVPPRTRRRTQAACQPATRRPRAV